MQTSCFVSANSSLCCRSRISRHGWIAGGRSQDGYASVVGMFVVEKIEVGVLFRNVHPHQNIKCTAPFLQMPLQSLQISILYKKPSFAESLDINHYVGILGTMIDAILLKYEEER